MWKFNVVPYKDEDTFKLLSKHECIGAVIVGNNKYALRCSADFSITEIKELVQKFNKEVIVNVNKLFHNHEMMDVENYLNQLVSVGVKTIIVADLGIVEIVKRLNINLDIIYSTETTITNKYFSEFASDLNLLGIELAKEITLNEIKEICDYKKCQVGISIHGQIYMYQSIRRLLTNYQEEVNIKLDDNKEYRLYDNERDVYYPVIENEQGTHILSSNDLCMIHKLDDLIDVDLDYVKLDSYLYKTSDFNKILELYINAYNELINDKQSYIDNKKSYLNQVNEIAPYKSYSTGFFYKKTIY